MAFLFRRMRITSVSNSPLIPLAEDVADRIIDLRYVRKYCIHGDLRGGGGAMYI